MIYIYNKLKKSIWEIKRFGGFFFRTAEEFCHSRQSRENARYIRYYRHLDVDPKCILYEVSCGQTMLGNPYDLFQKLLKDPEYDGFRHIWVLNSLHRHKDDIAGYSEQKNVDFIEYRSRDYLKALCTAKYLVNDASFPLFFIRKPDQVYIKNEDDMRNGKAVVSIGTTKKSILFYCGVMRTNGISSALINLLKIIDYDRFDVYVVVAELADFESVFLSRIDPRVRLITHKGGVNGTFWDEIRRRILNAYGRRGLGYKICPDNLYAEEAKRWVEGAVYDYVIDYDGYVIDEAIQVSKIPGTTHCIWLHNDMEAEKKLKYPDLENLFSIYPLYDRIVSCSETVMELNRKNIANTDTYRRYAFCPNAIDAEQIQVLSMEESPYPVEATESDSKIIHFITIGRFSPEKNHINLIYAFREFLDLGYDADLYILGDGPLRQKMEELIQKLDLGGHVILTGNIENPYAIMRKSDCFILPSLHEGQPIVILEARVLRLPILMTEFSTAKDSMIPNGQYIIGSSVTGILDGLIAYARGQVPADDSFNSDDYNKEVYQRFLDAINASM